jgi:hypothetical protein
MSAKHRRTNCLERLLGPRGSGDVPRQNENRLPAIPVWAADFGPDFLVVDGHAPTAVGTAIFDELQRHRSAPKRMHKDCRCNSGAAMQTQCPWRRVLQRRRFCFRAIRSLNVDRARGLLTDRYFCRFRTEFSGESWPAIAGT